MYEKKIAKNGRIYYQKDGRFVARDNVPEEILAELDGEATIEEQPTSKECVFCGEFADSRRWLNGVDVDLCQEHYSTTTVGETAQRVREINGRKDSIRISG